MKNFKLLVLIAVCLSAFAAACTTSSSSTPTAEPTPTPIPVDLVTVDPNIDPDAFLAALPASEVTCAEAAAGGRERLVQLIQYEDNSGPSPDDDEVGAVVSCLSAETGRGVLIGQIDRLAGGLSDETIACMADRVSAVALQVVLSQAETEQVDAYLSLARSVFCLNDAERTALETNAGETFGFERVGYINALECSFDYRDADGNAVFEQVFEYLEIQSDGELDFSNAQDQELLRSMFAVIPVGVECGLIRDEDFGDAGFTAEQFACLAREGGDAFVNLMTIAEDGGTATPDFGDLADLLRVFDTCGISLDQIITDSESGPTGGMPEPTITLGSTVEVPSFDELDLPLTEEQLACLQGYVSEEDIMAMIESGQPPANLFEALAACDVSLEDLLQ